ncbi:MAG: putative Ig domain-containing protein [Mesorhizobium sp.]
MDNNALKGSGPSFIADLARMGGDVEGSMTQDMLKGSGPSFPADLARMGGGIVGPQISGTPVLTGQSGVAYAGFTVSTKGGAAPLAYAKVGTWPTGLAVNSSTGAVTGTPTQDGTFADLSVKVTDADSEVSQLPLFTLVIAPA